MSSMAHQKGEIHWEDLNFEETPYSAAAAYSQSKLANILFTKQLADRFVETGVAAYCLHPGVVSTDLSRHLGIDLSPKRYQSNKVFD